MNVFLGVVDVSGPEVLLNLLSIEGSLFDRADLYFLGLRLDVGRLFLSGCGFALEAMLNIPEGGLIVLIPLLELLNLGPKSGNEEIQA